MLSRTLLTVGLLGNLLSLSGHAQTAPTSSRFYVGIGANLLSNVPFNSKAGVPSLVGPALTAGLQFTPHLAVQAGLSYQWQKDSYSNSYANPYGPSPVVTTSTSRYKYFLVPVLLRYTFNPAAERFHFDAQGGVTLIHATSHYVYDSNYSANPYHSESSDSDTRANLTLGPAVRYAVSPHIELAASSIVSAILGESASRFSDRLFLNTAIGVHYTFGQR